MGIIDEMEARANKEIQRFWDSLKTELIYPYKSCPICVNKETCFKTKDDKTFYGDCSDFKVMNSLLPNITA
jgi:hypothetical protein